ncbi:Mitogen-activated protein kinase 13 isoform X1 [Oopsacas minuta]|uniref:Mitogen-activated protein kinase 13 isoform X1 n=1 Tax=Oopsacas minuta TaxID=111878 RepID=A0AAV7K457_9METZ|nr:Mitogen-activated protein kinase 13 isoform X1 [Oopsacas minuta]
MACQDESLSLQEWVDFEVQWETWQLPRTYSAVEYIGKGAFGSVCQAFDSETNGKVAIKCCTMMLLYADRALSFYTELSLLSHFNHKNIVNILDILMSPFSQNIPDSSISFYIVLELCHRTLYELIKSNPLTGCQIQSYISQTLQGLRYIHSAGVVHRDINPYNLMVDNNEIIKIIDFGLASSEVSIGYVSTWWNNTPEIVLGWPADYRVDIWAVGCVLFEMVTGSPLFTSTDASKVLTQMIDILEINEFDWIDNIQDKRLYETAKTCKGVQKNHIIKLVNSCSKDLTSFLENLLCFDAKIRPSAKLALEHSFLKSFPTNDFIACPVYHDYVKGINVSIEDLKKLIFKRIDNFNDK